MLLGDTVILLSQEGYYTFTAFLDKYQEQGFWVAAWVSILNATRSIFAPNMYVVY